MTNQHFLDMLRTASMQARIAAHLYRGPEFAQRLAAQHGATCLIARARNAQAAALVFADHIHMTVCGTNDIHDWMDNVSARHKAWAGLDAHAGFVRAASSLLPAFTAIELNRYTSRLPLVIGGHSAGGAIAELLSCVRWLHPREVVTFGSPRVFATDSAAQHKAEPWKQYRFVSGGDPVPGLPLREFRCLFGRAHYSHTSQPIELAEDGKVMVGQEISLARSFARHAASWLLYGGTLGKLNLGKWPSLARNHSIDRYADQIDKALTRYGA